MIQYKIDFVSTTVTPQCGTAGNLTIVVDDGNPKLDGELIQDISIYYSGSDNDAFQLTCDDGSTDDHVHDATKLGTADDNGTWPSSGGCRWWRSSGNLVLAFTPPEPARDGARVVWIFDPDTPGLSLKVKIKRQESAESGACSGWTPIAEPT